MDLATEISKNNKEGVAQNPVNDIVGSVKNPISSQGGGGLEDSTIDKEQTKSNVEENPINNNEDCLTNVVNDEPYRIPKEAKEILKSLATQWKNVLDPNALQVIPLKGAMTNEVFQIKWKTIVGETSRNVLVRIHGEGTSIFFNRDDEFHTFEFMSKKGHGPRLLGRFANGRIEEFIKARTLSASDMRDPSISALIAFKLKEFHDLNMPRPKKVYLWDRLRNWLNEARRLSSQEEIETFHLDTIGKEIDTLEKELSRNDERIGFCHNDLQYGNIMLNEETNSMTIIDYEYASYNPIAYDIANHFCEMVANYHTDTPHILDYTKYPDLEERQRFVRTYLSSSGEKPSDREVEQLMNEVEKYTLASHLLWGIWGIISEHVNNIDFDYKEYAKQRFQEYWSCKPLLLSSHEPSQNNLTEANGEKVLTSTKKGTPTKKSTSTKSPKFLRKLRKLYHISLIKPKH